MPPFLPRKRVNSNPPDSPPSQPVKKARLADVLDADSARSIPNLARTKTFSLGSDTDSSSLSDVDSDEFEDVTVDDDQSTTNLEPRTHDEDDDGIEWEDAAAPHATSTSSLHNAASNDANEPLQLTFRKEDEFDYSAVAAASGVKKGPTKREKQVRIHAHQMHVQFLMFHNAIRNSWAGDKTVQKTLIDQLPVQITREVIRWKRASGLIASEPITKPSLQKSKKRRRNQANEARNRRDWGNPSQRLEEGKPDMSNGDPLVVLLRVLSAYWKKRFAIIAPGLRKRGYGTKQGLKQDIRSYRNDQHDPEKHGERIKDLKEFRAIAETCEGSRDVGAQLFTALLRGIGIEARLVASLQPCGYGWTKAEQMITRMSASNLTAGQESWETEPFNAGEVSPSSATAFHGSKRKRSSKDHVTAEIKPITIDLDSDSEKEETSIKDDESLIDITPSIPRQRKPKYDRDLMFPIYWTEAISPITNRIIPVSPLVLEIPVASTPETLAAFEPRGAKAEKARQVLAYVVAHSMDGTAKDVTVRYIRKNVWPGKTKGFRLPPEKIPVYDEGGKIERHEDFDWFKRVMSPYQRSHAMRTPSDDVEDSTDLVPQLSEKKKDDEGVDTLQSLKASADFVLERFLRREEALRPNAQPVRTFVSGKGEKYRQESVYRRSDVERCLTAESWHKEGRRPKFGESAMKFVPVRAVTLTRKREAEEHERQTGEKQMQGLYSWDQTEYIIPPPIKDGIIPKNSYGNMDCFVPSMVPKGAVHIPLKGTVRICKRLEIDFAEAVTGFEFGNKRAVPVCTGVVVAKQNERVVRDAWQVWSEEQRRKEETKMEALVLGLWRKFVMGLRIRERIADVYGDDVGLEMPATGLRKDDPIQIEEEDDNGGRVEGVGGHHSIDDQDDEFAGGFLMPHEDDVSEAEDLVMDDRSEDQKYTYQKIVTVQDRYQDLLVQEPPEVVPQQSTVPVVEDSSETSSDNLHDDTLGEHEDDPMDFPAKNHPDTLPRKTRRITTRTGTNTKDTGGLKETDQSYTSANLHANVCDDLIDSSPKPRTKGKDLEMKHEQVASEESGGIHDDFNEDEEEVYTPRATRTRPAKPPSNDVLRDADKLAKIKSSAKEPRPKVHTSPVSSRKRGRPRKNNKEPHVSASSNSASVRLLRKESTLVTSPFFKSDE